MDKRIHQKAGERGVQVGEVSGDVYVGARPTSFTAPFQAPPLSAHFIPRPEISDALVEQLVNTPPDTTGVLVISAIHGLGGIGKTTLAQAVAHDERTRDFFPGGVLWTTLGQQPNPLQLLSAWIQALGDFEFSTTSTEAATAHLRSILHDQATLIVVDDAWDPDHARPFLVGGPRCRVLITTRRADVAEEVNAHLHSLDVMTPVEALQLLTACLGRPLDEHETGEAAAVARAVGYSPLALELAAARARHGVSWNRLYDALEEEVARLEVLEGIRRRRSAHTRLEASLNLSLQALRDEDKDSWLCYVTLGTIPDDTVVAAPMAANLWRCGQEEAAELLELLWNDALLLPAPPTRLGAQVWKGYRLHDLLHDVARRRLTASPPGGLGKSLEQAHTDLVNNYHRSCAAGSWHGLPADGYIHEHLVWHLERAGQQQTIHELFREENEAKENLWYSERQTLGQLSGYINDLSRASQLVEEQTPLNAEAIGQQIFYNAARLSLATLVGQLSTDLVLALLEHNVWTAEQALDYARQITSHEQRADVFCAFIPLFPKDALSEVITDLPGLGPFAERVIQALAPHLAEELMDSAIAVVRELGKGQEDALSTLLKNRDEHRLAKILPAVLNAGDQLTDQQVDALLAAARELEDAGLRRTALAIIAIVSPDEALSRILENAHFEDKGHFADLVGICASRLPQDFWNGPIAETVISGENELFLLAPYLPVQTIVDFEGTAERTLPTPICLLRKALYGATEEELLAVFDTPRKVDDVSLVSAVILHFLEVDLSEEIAAAATQASSTDDYEGFCLSLSLISHELIIHELISRLSKAPEELEGFDLDLVQQLTPRLHQHQNQECSLDLRLSKIVLPRLPPEFPIAEMLISLADAGLAVDEVLPYLPQRQLAKFILEATSHGQDRDRLDDLRPYFSDSWHSAILLATPEAAEEDLARSLATLSGEPLACLEDLPLFKKRKPAVVRRFYRINLLREHSIRFRASSRDWLDTILAEEVEPDASLAVKTLPAGRPPDLHAALHRLAQVSRDAVLRTEILESLSISESLSSEVLTACEQQRQKDLDAILPSLEADFQNLRELVPELEGTTAAWCLVGLLEAFPALSFQEALALVPDTEDDAVLELLAGELVARLAESEWSHALESLSQVPESARLPLLQTILPRLPASLLPQALTQVDSLTITLERATLLNRLIRRIPQHGLPDLVERIRRLPLRQMQRWGLLSGAISVAPRSVGDALLKSAFDETAELPFYFRQKARRMLFRGLGAEDLPLVLELSANTDAEICMDFVSRLPEPPSDEQLPAVMHMAYQAADTEVFTRLLRRVASRLARPQVAEAMTWLKELSPSASRCHTRVVLASRLPAAARARIESDVLTEVLASHKNWPSTEVGEILGHISHKLLFKEAQESLGARQKTWLPLLDQLPKTVSRRLVPVADDIRDPDLRKRVLKTLLKDLADSQDNPVLVHVLLIEASEPSSELKPLLKLLDGRNQEPLVPDEILAAALDKALDRTDYRPLARLAQQTPPHLLPPLLQRISRLESQKRFHIFDELLPALPENLARTTLLDEVQRTATDSPSDWYNSFRFLRIAEKLDSTTLLDAWTELWKSAQLVPPDNMTHINSWLESETGLPWDTITATFPALETPLLMSRALTQEEYRRTPPWQTVRENDSGENDSDEPRAPITPWSAIVPHFPPEHFSLILEALPDLPETERALLLGALIQWLPSASIGQVLDGVEAVGASEQKAWLLHELAPILEGEALLRSVQIACGIQDDELLHELFRELLPRCPFPSIEVTVERIRLFQDRRRRSEALLNCLPFVAEERREIHLEEILSASVRISDQEGATASLMALASRLSSPWREQVLQLIPATDLPALALRPALPIPAEFGSPPAHAQPPVTRTKEENLPPPTGFELAMEWCLAQRRLFPVADLLRRQDVGLLPSPVARLAAKEALSRLALTTRLPELLTQVLDLLNLGDFAAARRLLDHARQCDPGHPALPAAEAFLDQTLLGKAPGDWQDFRSPTLEDLLNELREDSYFATEDFALRYAELARMTHQGYQKESFVKGFLASAHLAKVSGDRETFREYQNALKALGSSSYPEDSRIPDSVISLLAVEPPLQTIRQMIPPMFRLSLRLAGLGSYEEALSLCQWIQNADLFFEPARELHQRLITGQRPLKTVDLARLPQLAPQQRLTLAEAAAADLNLPQAEREAFRRRRLWLHLLEARRLKELFKIAHADQEAYFRCHPTLQGILSTARERQDAEAAIQQHLQAAWRLQRHGFSFVARRHIQMIGSLDPTYVPSLPPEDGTDSFLVQHFLAVGQMAFDQEDRTTARALWDLALQLAPESREAQACLEMVKECPVGDPWLGGRTALLLAAGDEAHDRGMLEEARGLWGKIDASHQAAKHRLKTIEPVEVEDLDFAFDLDLPPLDEFDDLGDLELLDDLPDLDDADHGKELGAENQAKIHRLIAEGDAFYQRNEYNSAIDTWSRIFLIDITHEEASKRIAMARQVSSNALLRQGDEAFAAKDFAAAIKLWNQIRLRDFPESLSQVELELRLHKAARLRDEKARDDAELLRSRANQMLAEGEFQEALDAWSEIARTSPLDAEEAKSRIGEARLQQLVQSADRHLSQEGFEEALDIIATIDSVDRKQRPGLRELVAKPRLLRKKALLDEGEAAAELGDDEQAIEIWSKIYALRPGDLETGQRIDQAYQRLAAPPAERIHQLLEGSRKLFENGDLNRARELAVKGLDLDPGNEIALATLDTIRQSARSTIATEVRQQLSQLRELIDAGELDKASERSPQVALQIGQLSEASDGLGSQLSRELRHLQTMQDLTAARRHTEEGDDLHALVCWSQVLLLDVDNPEAIAGLQAIVSRLRSNGAQAAADLVVRGDEAAAQGNEEAALANWSWAAELNLRSTDAAPRVEERRNRQVQEAFQRYLDDILTGAQEAQEHGDLAAARWELVWAYRFTTLHEDFRSHTVLIEEEWRRLDSAMSTSLLTEARKAGERGDLSSAIDLCAKAASFAADRETTQDSEAHTDRLHEIRQTTLATLQAVIRAALANDEVTVAMSLEPWLTLLAVEAPALGAAVTNAREQIQELLRASCQRLVQRGRSALAAGHDDEALESWALAYLTDPSIKDLDQEFRNTYERIQTQQKQQQADLVSKAMTTLTDDDSQKSYDLLTAMHALNHAGTPPSWRNAALGRRLKDLVQDALNNLEGDLRKIRSSWSEIHRLQEAAPWAAELFQQAIQDFEAPRRQRIRQLLEEIPGAFENESLNTVTSLFRKIESLLVRREEQVLREQIVAARDRVTAPLVLALWPDAPEASLPWEAWALLHGAGESSPQGDNWGPLIAGQEAFSRGEYCAAIELWQEALRGNPSDAAIEQRMAFAHKQHLWACFLESTTAFRRLAPSPSTLAEPPEDLARHPLLGSFFNEPWDYAMSLSWLLPHLSAGWLFRCLEDVSQRPSSVWRSEALMRLDNALLGLDASALDASVRPQAWKTLLQTQGNGPRIRLLGDVAMLARFVESLAGPEACVEIAHGYRDVVKWWP